MSAASSGKGARRALTGSARYELLMQIRRGSLWVVMAVFVAWAVTQFGVVYLRVPEDPPLAHVVAGWSVMLQAIVPIAVGTMLADRLPRDGSTRVDELLETLPASPGGRLLGKYAGSTLATILPMFLAYAAAMVYVAVDRGQAAAVPLGALSFLAVNLPGLLFVAAFSVSCPAVLWVPLYLFLFVGYWFWGTLLSPDSGIPTLSGTWLNPLGEGMANGFFGVRTLHANGVAAWEGAASIGLLLGLGALALLCAHLYLRQRWSGR